MTEKLCDKAKVFIITDMHIWDKQIGANINYVNEIKKYATDILHMIEREEVGEDEEKIVVFLGDIFHREFNQVQESLWWIGWFLELRMECDRVFTVMGNHELTYYKNNLFWHMVNYIKSEKVNSIVDRAVTARGRLNLIEVWDDFVVGGFRFKMFHNRCGFSRGKTDLPSIGLFHEAVLEEEISSVMRSKGLDLKEKYLDRYYLRNLDVFENMKYAYLGHMHTAYGEFLVETDIGNELELNYLGSIGRTNSAEVVSGTERCVPILKINGDEISEEKYRFQLEDNVLDLEIRDESKEKYEMKKNLLEITKKDILMESPVGNVRKILSESKASSIGLLEDLLMGSIAQRDMDIIDYLTEGECFDAIGE